MDERLDIIELTTKLGGIILKKAELDNNFEGVYSRVFKRMFEIEETSGDEFLAILGDVGG